MKELAATIASDGRVLIPAEIRQRLGVRTDDQVIFVIDDLGEVVLRPPEPDIDDLFGSVPALAGRETVDFDELIDEAMAAEAARIQPPSPSS